MKNLFMGIFPDSQVFECFLRLKMHKSGPTNGCYGFFKFK